MEPTQPQAAPPGGVTREVIEALRRMSLDANRYAHRVSRELGMPPTDVHAVGILHSSSEGLSATELGHVLALTPSATTSLIDRLERNGHAVRDVSSQDARRASNTPTDDAVAQSRAGSPP